MKEIIELTNSNNMVSYLSSADETMNKLICLIENHTIKFKIDRFESLVKSIIGQQLSVKAANTIFIRFKSICVDITPENILSLPENTIREVGVSKQKISYIKDLSHKIITMDVDLTNLEYFSNENVIKFLTKVKGIGHWTAEMFLIFSLGRMDVLSLGDIGLQRSCKWLYNASSDKDGKKFLQEKGKNWDPYFSVASFYLWEAIDRGYVDNYSSIDEVYGF